MMTKIFDPKIMKGPWSSDDRPFWDDQDKDGWAYIKVPYVDRYISPIAQVELDEKYGVSKESAEQNLTAILAVPELLYLVKALREYLDDHGPSGMNSCDELRAALRDLDEKHGVQP